MRKGEDYTYLFSSVGALKTGSFRLSSGLASDYFLDSSALFARPYFARLIVPEFVNKILDVGVFNFGAVMHGAVPLVYQMALHFANKGLDFVHAFTIPKVGQGASFLGDIPSTYSEVVIIEDVLTTGASVKRAIASCEAMGFTVRKVLCLFDRNQGGSASLREFGLYVWSLFDVGRDLDGYVQVVSGDTDAEYTRVFLS